MMSIASRLGVANRVMVIPARRGLTVFRRVHPEHALTHLATSLDMPGHQ